MRVALLLLALSACEDRLAPVADAPLRGQVVALTGHVALPAGVELPDGAIVRVEARAPGAPAPLGETRAPTQGVQSPYPFELKMRPTAGPIELHASILVGDRVAFAGAPARVARGLESAKVAPIALISAPEAPSPEPMVFRAMGHEPSWGLDLGADSITFTSLGAAPLTVPTPRRAGAGGKRVRWGGEGLRVEAVPVQCNDVATGLPYPLTVSVVVGDVVYDGCGGDPASYLVGAPWTVVEIAGAPVDLPEPPTLAFGDDGRVTGNSGCNQYMAPFALTGEGLRVEAIGGTKMACDGPGADVEVAFYAALGDAMTFDVDLQGRLVVKANDGRVLIARR